MAKLLKNAIKCKRFFPVLAGSDGAAVKELLTTIMTNTPHMWSQHTLQCFPPVLVEFFSQVNFSLLLLALHIIIGDQNWPGEDQEDQGEDS